jgi:hypothetical protein
MGRGGRLAKISNPRRTPRRTGASSFARSRDLGALSALEHPQCFRRNPNLYFEGLFIMFLKRRRLGILRIT